MVDDVSLTKVNPFSNFSLGGSMGTFATIGIVIAIALIILVLGGLLIYMVVIKRNYNLKIVCFRLVGNIPTKVATFSAREVPLGMAGDKLWRVAPAGFFKFTVIKWLPVGKLQTAPMEFWYWIREDGEWINFIPSDIDAISRTMNIKFVQEDMRLQRLATDRLLEQRLMNKTFWEQWGNAIMTVILFLVIAICVVIIFYQFGKIVDQLEPILKQQSETLDNLAKNCKLESASGGGQDSNNLVPVVK